MRTIFAGLLALLSACAAFAQGDLNSVTVTASQQVMVQPDTGLFELTVFSGPGITYSGILNALAASGVTNAALQSVTFIGPYPYASGASVAWGFTITVPLASEPETINSLTSLVSSLAQGNSGLTATFNVMQQSSAQALASSQCSQASLTAAATSTAASLAGAVQRSLGPIVAESNVATVPIAGGVIGIPGLNIARAGNFALQQFNLAVPAALSCTVVVRFALGFL